GCLFSIGRTFDIGIIVDVIKALFEELNSDDLLANFRTLAEQKGPAQQDNQDVDSTNRVTIKNIPVAYENFREFLFRFWLEIIGGDNVDQLRYYLTNMLVFDTIPLIISQVLESRRYDKAVDLAQQISQLPAYTDFVAEHFQPKPNHLESVDVHPATAPNLFELASVYPAIVPNYFEFIMFYVTKRYGPVDVVRTAHLDADGRERSITQ
ncbi:hypothetical protein H4R34_006043, partial [Dimargaris verticillata]